MAAQEEEVEDVSIVLAYVCFLAAYIQMQACLLHSTDDLSVRDVTHSFSATMEAHIPLILYMSQIISSNTVNMALLRSS